MLIRGCLFSVSIRLYVLRGVAVPGGPLTPAAQRYPTHQAAHISHSFEDDPMFQELAYQQIRHAHLRPRVGSDIARNWS